MQFYIWWRTAAYHGLSTDVWLCLFIERLFLHNQGFPHLKSCRVGHRDLQKLTAIAWPWTIYHCGQQVKQFLFMLLCFSTMSVELWWLHAKESACQCRRCRIDPWVWKIPWRRKWLPTPVFLSGESHGQRDLEGYSPWGHKRVKHNLMTTTTTLYISIVFNHIPQFYEHFWSTHRWGP